MGDYIREKSAENEFLKSIVGSCDKKWLEEYKAKLLKQNIDKKRANLLTSRIEKQMKKQKKLKKKDNYRFRQIMEN